MSQPAFITSYAILWILIFAMAVVQFALIRHLGVLYQALDPLARFTKNETKLPLGRRLPRITLLNTDGSEARWKELDFSTRCILICVRHPCDPCADILAAARNHGNDPGVPPLTVIVEGPYRLARETEEEYFADVPTRPRMLADPTRGAWRRWEVMDVPTVLLVEQHRVVGRLTRPTEDALTRFIGAVKSGGTSTAPANTVRTEVTI